MKKIISEQSVVRPSEKMKKSLETYYPTQYLYSNGLSGSQDNLGGLLMK